ncbi:Nuclear transport receptor LGL2 (importin beta superfamily) [Phytophthora cinnamomi]|uniref:Nuclear transport receptor LGL2 (importin beta superfamily) n=1 Tax=Phytophthora cinnamomi TaxID=4785 RepID=UPI0035595F8F|nr:Nuclear transport receptor LGL2 (importin beta superfamily) [Phytophthora cinnamomi]
MAESPLPMVLSAVQALYGMEGAARQREANEFLNSFAASDAAWGVGFQLLRDEALALPPEALFFAANMLHSKVRKEWVRLSAEQRAAMTASLQTLMQVLRAGTRPGFHQGPLASKLCAIYAVAMISAPDDCKALLSQLLASCSATGDAGEIAFLLAFSRCVCEEMEDAELAFAAKDAMEVNLATLSGDLVTLIGKIILTREDQDSRVAALHGEALSCLNVWVKRAGLSLATLYSKDEAVLLALLEALQSKSRHLHACAEILSKLITVASYPTPAQLEKTLLVVAQGLLKTRAACESALAADEDEVGHALTDVISTFCETYADWILEGEHPQEAAGLGELMLYLGSHPRRQIASLTLEFWLVVQDEPVASRLHFYQHDAFMQLFDVLLKQCAFPAGNAENMDELERDDLLAFRGGFQGVSEAFLAIFALLKEQFLAHLLPILTSAATSEWQNIEVALFAVSIVADDIKKKLPTGPATTAQQAELENIVSQIFQAVLNSTASSHPLVITVASRLLGQFSAWINDRALAARSFDTVGTLLQYLTGALGLSASRTNAAKSFMQVATSCTGCLKEMQPSVLVASVLHFGATAGQEAMPIEDRLLVVEGLVRAAAVSPHCSIILQSVLNDSLTRLDQVLAVTGTDDPAVVIQVCSELQVLGKVMRFLDAPEDVAGALFELYGWCLQSLRQDMALQLGNIATLIVRVFEQRRFVAPLECASVAVDVFGKGASAEIVDSFRGLMGALSQSAFQFFTTHSLAESPEVLRSFFELAYRFLLFCPAAVLTAAEFPVLIELSLACLGNQDRPSTNAVIMFLTFLVNESTFRLAPFTAVINATVLDAGQTEKWLDGLVGALALKSPSGLYDALSKLLYALLTSFTDNERVRTSLMQSLSRDALGVAELRPEDRQQVLHLWLSLAAQPSAYSKRRFLGLCTDFAKVCRKELTADTLHSIEPPN